MEDAQVQVSEEKDCHLNIEDKDVNLNNIALEEYFRRIVEGNSVEFELNHLNDILRKDLQVNFHYLKPQLKYVVPYMLVHFIKCWPGWHKSNNYFNKQITFNNWFAKFKEYLVFKINYMIKNDYEKVKLMIKTNPFIDDKFLFKIDNSTQISIPSEKSVSPYYIHIQGIPRMLNSLIFCEGAKDSIIIKEYKTNPFIGHLTTKQLLNWPYIEVEFLSKELNFKRENMHEFQRCLMLSNEKINFKKIETVVEEIDIINEQIGRAAYALNVLRQYCDTFVAVLKHQKKTMGITDDYISDIKTIFDEFVLDITELNMNSMATNTSVLFNIGKYIYARNKSVRTSGQAVCFAESITPKVKLSLIDFNGVKDEKSDIPFQGLHEVLYSTDRDFIKNFLPGIRYGCTYCNKYYSLKTEVLDHFIKEHCMEQPVLCFKCKLQIDVIKICENRWGHQCGSKNNNG